MLDFKYLGVMLHDLYMEEIECPACLFKLIQRFFVSLIHFWPPEEAEEHPKIASRHTALTCFHVLLLM